MKIFISWSGDRSKAVAIALKSWLGDVFIDVQTWMSDHDISAGARWSDDLDNELESTNFGVLCLTPENLKSSWLLFEAGSLAKIVKNSRVVPYRLGVSETDVEYPLARFQGVDADKAGTYKLLRSINEIREAKLEDDRLERLFEVWWPSLEARINDIQAKDQGSDSIEGEYHTGDSRHYRITITHLSGDYYRIENPDWEGVGFVDGEFYYTVFRINDKADPSGRRGNWGAHRARFSPTGKSFEVFGTELKGEGHYNELKGVWIKKADVK